MISCIREGLTNARRCDVAHDWSVARQFFGGGAAGHASFSARTLPLDLVSIDVTTCARSNLPVFTRARERDRASDTGIQRAEKQCEFACRATNECSARRNGWTIRPCARSAFFHAKEVAVHMPAAVERSIFRPVRIVDGSTEERPARSNGLGRGQREATSAIEKAPGGPGGCRL